MSKIKYKTYKPTIESQVIIEYANTILNEYASQGFDLTLRQLYYQFVARDVLPNSTQSYNKLGSVVKRAREGGMINWTHIQDRARPLRAKPHWSSGSEFFKSASGMFNLDLWEGQRRRVEVWVEKEALAQVVSTAVEGYDVPCIACKGYMSTSAMWDAAHNRFLHDECNDFVILHLGDHDPSGIHMTEDIQDRLEMFSTPYHGMQRPLIEVRRIALNMDQVNQFTLPPNPAKETDPRWERYAAQYGDESWELDALDPNMIVELIREGIEQVADMNLLEAQQAREEQIRDQFENLAIDF